MAQRPMGRPLSSSEKTGLYLDSDLKRRMGIEALRRGITISALVTQAIKAFLAPKRRTHQEHVSRRPTDEAEQGKVTAPTGLFDEKPAPKPSAPATLSGRAPMPQEHEEV